MRQSCQANTQSQRQLNFFFPLKDSSPSTVVTMHASSVKYENGADDIKLN